jgi:hypothetical protein
MEVKEWLRRLDDAFGEGAFIGPALLPVITAEGDLAIATARRYAGFFALSSCLQSFVLETLTAAQRLPLAKRGEGWYRAVLLSYAGSFRILRAAEILFLKGYPLNAYGLLRDLKDRIIAYGAIVNGYATFEEMNGWNIVDVAPGEFTIDHFRASREARKKVDRTVMHKMLGAQSGLTKQTREELRKWNEFFHSEVHGGRFTFALDGERWIRGRGPLPVFPAVTSGSSGDSMFITHYEELGWLLTRTLTSLQSKPSGFSSRWRERWHILEGSFRVVMEDRIAADHPVFAAFVEFAERKFDFSPEKTAYRESSA